MKEVIEFVLIFAGGYLLTMFLVFSFFNIFLPFDRVEDGKDYPASVKGRSSEIIGRSRNRKIKSANA